jgi:ABC-type transport system involved in cytochrome c biogenesis permease component
MGFMSEAPTDQASSIAKLWVSFFIAASSVFYRSFQAENSNRNFILFTQFRVPRIFIFISQSINQALRLFFIGMTYILILHFLFSFQITDWARWVLVFLEVSLCLAPLGTLLGLGLQAEREFLFSLIFIPLIAPIILAAHAMSLGEQISVWSSITGAFGIISWFISSVIFEFFFDDLTQTT